MKSVYSLVGQLETLGIHLYENEGRIRVRDPQNRLTDEFRQQIKELRVELLEFLSRPHSAAIESPIVRRAPSTTSLPLSFAQHRLWLFDQMQHGSALYNIPMLIRLRGRLDVVVLEQSLTYLIGRHESLRTTFDAVDGVPVQVIHSPAPLVLHTVTVEDEQQAQQIIQSEATTPFNLAKGPLLRAKLLKLHDTKHILLLTMHHIVSDGWSLGLLLQELTAVYSALTQGAEPTLSALPVQYADYALWQRDHLTERVTHQLDYWRKQLADAPTLLDLPTDRPRPAAQSYRGAHHRVHIDAELMERLNKVAHAHNATLYMVLLAAFNVLLAHYSRQRDIVVGAPIANRNHPQVENLIGCFFNTLALRTRLDDNPSFPQLLAEVRRTTLAAYEHQDTPFEQVVDELRLKRSLSHNPLFQVMFALENAEMGSLALPGLSATIDPAELPVSRFDIGISLAADTDGINGIVEYSTDLFDEATIERMMRHFIILLQNIATDVEAGAETPVMNFSFLTEEEHHQIVHVWNDTAVDFGAPRTIHALFEAQVARTPDAVAVVFGREQLTYRELNVRANQLANYLMEMGVRTGDPAGAADTIVAVVMERSLDLVVALLAVLKSGCAYLPIDPTYPDERIRYMLIDSQAPIVLTRSHLATVRGCGREVALNDIQEALDAQTQGNPQTQRAPSDLAYVIYTSGSTGHPKGVMVQHDGLYNLIRWHQRAFNVTAQDRASQMANPAFDATGWEIFPYLTAGATLVFTPDAHRRSPDELADWLAEEAITIAFVPTPMTNALLQAGRPLPVRQILTGGDKLNHFPPAEARYTLVNNYGPTENTVVATAGVITSNAGGAAPHIGKAIDNVQIYILNDALQPMPINLPGELCIGGAQLARGYLNRPQLTAERFIEHPQFGRLYKTGDLCRLRPDGTIEFLGRTDFQVKIRGFRIELGEIEQALLASPGIREAIVVAREDARREKQLVAYVVGNGDEGMGSGEAVDVDAVRRRLAQQLPEYMIPTALVTLDALPLTANGKINRTALPEPTVARTEEASVAPVDSLEAQLVEIWQELLHVDQVGLHDDFFELGGHSLLATQMISQLRTRLHIELPIETLFESSELAEFAQAIREMHNIQPQPATTRLQPVARRDQLPLSFAQQRLWFLDQLDPNSALYNISIQIRLKGQLDVTALERSLSYLIERHESLRTTFEPGGGAAVQVIHAPDPFSLPITVVADEEGARRLAVAEATQAFDLRHGPLLRVHLLRFNDQEHRLLLTMHHIISDGWSMGVLLKELTEAYTVFTAERAPALPQLPIQYADFAVWQRDHLTGEVLEKQLSFWREQLDGVPPLLELPTDRPRTAVQSHRGAYHEFLVDANLTAKLNQLALSHDASLFMVLLAAFNVLLARYSRQRDIVVGSPVANRNRAEIEWLIGSFVNMLALRTKLDEDPSFTAILEQVRQTALAAYEHQDLPFEQLVDELELERTLSYTPLFQVVLVLQNMPLQPFATPQLSATIEPTDLGLAKFDLTLNLRESDVGLHGILEYSTDLFDAATIERMAKHFQILLASITADPDQSLLQLPMLTAIERHQLVTTWNQPAAVHNNGRGQPWTIHGCFEAQVAQTPDAVALVMPQAWPSANGQSPSMDQRTLTYADLNVRANQLAHRLSELSVQRHVGENPLIAVVMERSPEMVVSLLAVLKAGGAYVPIDPTYPPERIAFTLQDCDAQIVLTERHLLDRLPDAGDRDDGVCYVCVSDDDLRQYPRDNPDFATNVDHLAYVIYTSGSTGQPKGALITHRNVWRLFAATDGWFGFNGTDVWTLFHSFAFDFSVWEMWGALCYGGRLVIVPYGVSRDPGAFYRLIREEGVTVLNQTPSAFRQLIPAAAQAGVDDALRYVIFGGEALDFESLRPWFLGRGDSRPQLVNMYGITETTVHVTYQPIAARDLEQHPGRSRIGHPIPDLQLYILDDGGQPTPINVPGELYVAGAGLAQGYLNRPELTAQRFVQHPEWGRLYKTGDLCRRLPDGNIEYLGRTDFQVKIRGFRIELGEIENALLAQPEVREAVTLVREDAGDKRLVAYLAGDETLGLSIEDLRLRLSQRLPEYMIPAAFVLLNEMPLTNNGKLDRHALPAPDGDNMTRPADYSAPRTRIQQAIATIWAEALGVEQVGLRDNFFDLGGHSLLVVQVCDTLRTALGQEIAVVDLFQYPTVQALAQHLGETDAVTTPVNGEADNQHVVTTAITQAQRQAERQKQARLQRRQRVL